MLSRLADSLFWLGRYLERAEDLSRILDVHVQGLTGAPTEKELAWTVDISTILSQPESWASTSSELIWKLAIERSESASVAYALDKAWQNARVARDMIPLELWEALNRTHFQLETWLSDSEGFSPHGFLGWVKDRVAVASGIANSAMMRDEGWYFFTLGQLLERSDIGLRLMKVKHFSFWPDAVVLLRCFSGHEAFLHVYRRPPTDATAVLFLLRNREFPRSVLSSLMQIQRCLEAIVTGEQPRSDGLWISEPKVAAFAGLGMGVAALRYTSDDDVISDARTFIEGLQDAVSQVDEFVLERFFSAYSDQRFYHPQMGV